MSNEENVQPTPQNQVKKNKPQQQRTFTPLTAAEFEEINNAASRSAGLGRIMLAVVRNRSARVVVTETPIGDELLTHATELDRILHRMGRQMTRNLNVDNMSKKAALEMEAAKFIQPLRELTAKMAVEFDEGDYIVRHPATRQLVRELRASGKVKKDKASESEKPQVVD